MGSAANEFYGYDNFELWDPALWYDRGAPADKLIAAACARAAAAPEAYPDRHDEVRDAVNRCPYFPDIIDGWEKRGMHFTAAGMMGLTMVPKAVMERTDPDPRILFIPIRADMENPHWAMNVLRQYEGVLAACAAETVLVQFLTSDGNWFSPMPELGLETQGTFRVSYRPVYLDVSALAGEDLAGFGPVTELGTLPVVEVTDKWQPLQAHQVVISELYTRFVPDWDRGKHLHSAQAKRQAESMRLELDYRLPSDPAFRERWERMGLEYEDHFYGRGWFVTLTPKCVRAHPERKLPLLLVMKEPRTAIPQALLTAFQFYYDFIGIAAQGEYMMLFFALEHPDDNDILAEILSEVEKRYPIDPSRVYIVGQSHNGYYALEFTRRHPELIAGCATLCDPMGLQVGATIDWYDADPEGVIRSFQSHDIPLINIMGQLENKYCTAPPGSDLETQNAVYFQRRLRAFRCPERSLEEIIAARHSDDYVTRVNGIPADRTEVEYRMGTECYISDLKNTSGKWHLRLVSIENLPHMIAPQMAELSWSFLRRFRRDQDTGDIAELY